MKLTKLLPLLTIACVGATLPITSCATGSVPPTPEKGSRFNFDEGEYVPTKEPLTPQESSYTTITCLQEYIDKVSKDRYEDDFLMDWQNEKNMSEQEGFIFTHLDIFISVGGIILSSSNGIALVSAHVIGEETFIAQDLSTQTQSYDLSYTNFPLEMVYGGNWKLVTADSESSIWQTNWKINGWLIINGDETKEVNINKDNMDDDLDLFDDCSGIISMEGGINSLKEFHFW